MSCPGFGSRLPKQQTTQRSKTQSPGVSNHQPLLNPTHARFMPLQMYWSEHPKMPVMQAARREAPPWAERRELNTDQCAAGVGVAKGAEGGAAEAGRRVAALRHVARLHHDGRPRRAQLILPPSTRCFNRQSTLDPKSLRKAQPAISANCSCLSPLPNHKRLPNLRTATQSC